MTMSIDDSLIKEIGETLDRNESLRRDLPDGSRLRIDRQLPFLCIYRQPPQTEDAGTERLLLGEAAYLLATSREQQYSGLVRLVQELAQRQSKYFGRFLLFELWSAELAENKPIPLFHIFAPSKGAPQHALEELESDLLAINIESHSTQVALTYGDSFHPPGLKPLLTAGKHDFISIGLEVNPIYRDTESGELDSFILRALHHALARALKRTFYTFAHSHTSQRPAHFYELGRHAISPVVIETDERLAAISQRFDLLLHVTPVNVPQAWQQFHHSKFENHPEFLYRPRPIDPALMKRELFCIPIEQIEDPTLAHIYREKQDELDRQITLVSDRNTSRFLSGSRQLFGDIEPELSSLAKNILQQLPPHLADDHDSDFLTAQQFAKLARDEIEVYRKQDPNFSARVEVRDDITGIFVSKGEFLIASDARVPRLRVEATLAHEIGTHVVTYYNGRQQPLCEFYTGMAGYESLQEGLAVLAEYLAGGLSRPRLRLLAGRVVAVQSIYQGADFIETFRVSHDQYGFSQATAFNIAMRVYRGGGYTKDAVYLRGLKNLLSYLALGGDLEMLLIGKISHEQLALVEELQWRKVLTPAVLRPRYLDRPETQHKLAFLRRNVSVLELASEETCN
ncbi:MAG: flavohemoglobin expression-modulating QEGLA motif protein [Gammaproteobacteria bacterium]